MARLRGAKRQNNQLQLAFEEATTSEARSQSSEGTEASVTECSAESLAPDEQWMERICPSSPAMASRYEGPAVRDNSEGVDWPPCARFQAGRPERQ